MISSLNIPNLGQKELPKEAIDALITNNYFKLFIPEPLGGLELELETACDYLVETAQIHPSLGWMHNLGAGANFFCGFFEPEIAQEIFSNPKVIVSGSGRPTGTFEKQGANYILNGKWDKCSGAKYASHLTCVANDIENPEQIKTFILPAKGVKLIDDWRIFGLSASTSYSYKLEKFELPNKYEFEINVIKSFHEYPIYGIPFEQFARICLSATFEGIARRLLLDTETEIRMPSKDFQKAWRTINQTLNTLKSDRKKLSAELYDTAIGNKLKNFNAHFKQISQHHNALFNLATQLYSHAGIRIAEEESPANWSFRDLLTAGQHYLLK
jgi:hypothetical protein